MIQQTKRASIARKLTWMNMLVSGAALLLACVAFIGYDIVTFRHAIVDNLSTQAQIIGSNSASALLFDDPQAAGNTLSALKAAPNILSAVIYTPEGQALASYSRDRSGRIPAPPSLAPGQLEVHALEGKEIILVRSIVFQGKPTGTVYLRSDLRALNDRLLRYAGIGGIVLLVSLIAALLVSSIFRRSIAKPIVDLAQIADVVSQKKDYSVRATPIGSQGELSRLIDAFNAMLEQIDHNEKQLRNARDQLEQRVRERTAELQAAKDELEIFSQTILCAKEEAERSNRFKDQFLSTMSHELRTPLNAVLGFSDLLGDDRYGPLTEKQKRYVNHIHSGGKHLLRLINDILDLSRIEAGRLQLAIENVRVDTSFSEALDTLHPLYSKKSQTVTKLSPNEVCVRADSTRFKQILINLLANAIKFTPDGGKIELSAVLDGESLRVQVQDTGPGIPYDEQKRIFEAFYRLRTTNKSVEGTGLGLAITQRLVELHGGELGLSSEPGHGSCFYFTVPIAPSVKPSDAIVAKDEMRRPAKILVIEDDPTAASLLETQLTSEGYSVSVCGDAKLAVEAVAANQPSAVTLDIMMKPVNGWRILTALKSDARTMHIPVIIVSIVDQPSTGALLGADEYVVKPVDKTVLLAAVERCVRKLQNTMQPSILVVEDHSPTREFISESLSTRGYSVVTAADGELARAQLAQKVPDLVILDLMLPKVSGFELLAEWRMDVRTAHLPVFILTSKDLTLEERAYLEANTAALMQKSERWDEALFKQLQRTVAREPLVKA